MGVDPTGRILWLQVIYPPALSYLWADGAYVGRCRCNTYKKAPGKLGQLTLGQVGSLGLEVIYLRLVLDHADDTVFGLRLAMTDPQSVSDRAAWRANALKVPVDRHVGVAHGACDACLLERAIASGTVNNFVSVTHKFVCIVHNQNLYKLN